ncbi:CopD family protein [Methyloversatilis thermotolerans]|uniref:CopD family protein n=1 Tax=Methyloversatilis thermotolerans TaxID=1346290 RepID=UPI00037585D8|nr:CopD family protein [Methyloversatilis thermotolerans]
MTVSPLLLFLHIAGVVIWVGGMFFAYVCLRPVAAAQLEPPQRLTLWAGVFARFLPLVWGMVALILASGLAMMLAVGMKAAPVHWHIMFGLGLLMMFIFMHVFFAPYRRLSRAVTASDWPAGGAALGQIRSLVGLNTALGFVVIAVATLGRLLAG